jgi:uncharacterized protein YkwD
MNLKEGFFKKSILISLYFVFIAAITLAVPKTSTAISLTGNALKDLSLVNAIREKNELIGLEWNERLAVAASEKAEDMVADSYFEHTAPDGVKAWNFILDAGYNYRYAGENLAIDFENINKAEQAWENSPTHLKNILGIQYSEFGFGEANGEINGKDTTVYVQLFGDK